MNRKKRVLHLPNTLSKKSGVMSFIMNYYRQIDRDLFQFDFLVIDTDEESYEQEIIELGGRVYKVKTNGSLDILNIVKYAKNFVKDKQNEFDLVHYHAISPWNFTLKSFKKYNSIPVIAHSHATMYSDNRISAFRNRFLVKSIIRNADYYFSCSIAAGKFLFGKDLYDNSKIHVIPNAVNCEKFRFNQESREFHREKLNLSGKFVVGHVGRFNEQKNHKYLIQVFHEIFKKNPNSHLLLVGTGPQMDTIIGLIKSLDLADNVTILSNRTDVNELLCAMDVFVLPSLFEGLPFVGVEAQVNGLKSYFSNTITREVGVSNYSFMDINLSPEKWALEILSSDEIIDRDQSCVKMVDNGFDIKEATVTLENLYSDIINNKEKRK